MRRSGGHVKKGYVAIAIGLAAFLLLAIIAGVWFVRFRPLSVYERTTRSALRRAGLHKVTVNAPAGPQLVWTGGSGPLLLLLHGAGDQAGTWSHVAPKLAKSYTLIIPDLAGHGDSAPSSGPIDAKMVYDGINSVIDTLAPDQTVVVAGNSLGAWMGMVLAHRRPEKVSMVVCIDGGAIQGTNEHATLLPKNREEARMSVAQTRDAGSTPIPDYVLDDIVRRATTGSLGRFASTSASMGDWVLDETALAEIRVPVRLVWGESDKLIPLEYAHRMQSSLKDVKLEVIPKCGHVPQAECPDAFVAAFEKALTTPSGARDASR